MKITFEKFVIRLCSLAAITSCLIQPAGATEKWDGPTEGPPGQSAKKITYISQDFKNGGISAAYRGFYVAIKELGWEIRLVDGKGDDAAIRTEFAAAIGSKPDAIILGGIQMDPSLADLADLARQSKIVLAGWHAAAEPGPTRDLFINIATDSAEVAKMAAEYVIRSSTGNIGVIIFNDSRFAVANAKTKYMKEVIDKCIRCVVLSVENLLISNATHEIPLIVPRLNKNYGKAWTHSLAINDVYFDAMNFPLTSINRKDVQNISAGDGSNIALSRISSGQSQQTATVAEPVNMQGWQLADELNRAFAGQPPSGHISKPILITTSLLKRLGGAAIDAEIPYRDAYHAIWRGKTAAPTENVSPQSTGGKN